jgi:hypothetical protein
VSQCRNMDQNQVGVCSLSIHFLRIRIKIHKYFSNSDMDSFNDILTCNFSKWCLSLLSYVFWYLYCWEKSFPMEKTHTGLSSVGSAFFHKFFYITTVSGSESVPESELFFGFWFDQNLRIRIHNTGMFNVFNIKFCVFCYPYCDPWPSKSWWPPRRGPVDF